MTPTTTTHLQDCYAGPHPSWGHLQLFSRTNWMVQDNHEEWIQSQENKWVAAVWITTSRLPNKRYHSKPKWHMIQRDVTSKKCHFLCRLWNPAGTDLLASRKSHHGVTDSDTNTSFLVGTLRINLSKGNGSDEFIMKNKADEVRHTLSCLVTELSIGTESGSFIHSSNSCSTLIHWVPKTVWSTMPGTGATR